MELKSISSPHIVYTEICKNEVDISNSSPSNIKTVLTQKKHRLAANSAAARAELQSFKKKYGPQMGKSRYCRKSRFIMQLSICTSKSIIDCLFEPKFILIRTK